MFKKYQTGKKGNFFQFQNFQNKNFFQGKNLIEFFSTFMLDDGDIKIEGPIERYRKFVSFTDKLVITTEKGQEERLEDFMNNFLKKNPKFKSSTDKCDRGINYIKLKRNKKIEILKIITELEKSGINYSILEHNLTDIVYGKFSRSICDGFSQIDLNHIKIPKISSFNKFLRSFVAVAYLEFKKRTVYKIESILKIFLFCLLFTTGYIIDIWMRDDNRRVEGDFVLVLIRNLVIFRLMAFSWFIEDFNVEYNSGLR